MRWTLKVSRWGVNRGWLQRELEAKGVKATWKTSTRGDFGRGENRMQIHFRSRIVAFYILHVCYFSSAERMRTTQK